MDNNKPDIDSLLKRALSSNERPSTELIDQIKNTSPKEITTMKNIKFKKPIVAAAALLLTTLSVGAVAYGSELWRQHQTRIVEGHNYVSDFTMKTSPDGYTISGIELTGTEMGRVVVEIDGEEQVMSDPIHFDNLGDALALFAGAETPAVPSFLPDGFEFVRAWMPLNPITNPDLEWAGTQLYIMFGNASEEIVMEVRHNPEEWGLPIWGALDEITINGRQALVGDGAIAVQATEHTMYSILKIPFGGSLGSNMSYDTLIEIAKSLQ